MRIKVMLSAKPFLLLSYTCPPLPCTSLLSQWDQIKINFQSGKINDKWQILGSRLFFLRFLQSFSKSTKSVSIIYFAPLCKVTDQIHYVFLGAAAEATHSGSKCIKFAWNMISPNFSKQLSAFPFLVNTWTAYSKLVTGIVWSVNWMMNQFYDKIDLFLAGFWLLVQLFGGAFAARRVKSGHH